jgi:hypothetical protein
MRPSTLSPLAKYYEHPSKASRWESGRLVVLEDAEQADCTCWFLCEEEGRKRWEGLLGRRLSIDHVRVCAIPVLVYDVNLADEVVVRVNDDGALVATEIVRDAGNFTFRILFPDDAPPDPYARLLGLMVDLERLGCWFDVWSPFVVALSAPPEHAEDVADYLDEREQRGDLEYETGRTRNPT